MKILIRNDIRPGDLGAIVYLHGVLYAEEYGFDHTFEPYVAAPLSQFVLSPLPRNRIWIVEKNGQVRGSVAIVKSSETDAQLRWYLLHPGVRGRGLGKKLLDEAILFAWQSGYRNLFLWTVGGLEAATAIYKKRGFILTESKDVKIWGKSLTEERYELAFGSVSPVPPGGDVQPE